MKYLKRSCLFIFLILSIASCKRKDVTAPAGEVSILKEEITLNPFGNAPLTATISIETSVKTKISVRVAGKHGSASDVSKDFDELGTLHDIPVLGLYAGYANTVEITFKDSANNELDKKSYNIQTAVLPGNFPAVSFPHEHR